MHTTADNLRKFWMCESGEIKRSFAAGACYAAVVVSASVAALEGADRLARVAAPQLAAVVTPDRVPRFAPADFAQRGASSAAVMAKLEAHETTTR